MSVVVTEGKTMVAMMLRFVFLASLAWVFGVPIQAALGDDGQSVQIPDLAFLLSPEGMAIGAVGVDILMRFLKTTKPWSILWTASRVMAQVAKAMENLAKFMDKVLPQKLK